MEHFNNKQISLLLQLLKFREEYISSENLGIITGLSAKTVREELQQMMPVLHDLYGISIVSKKGLGYSIPEISFQQYKHAMDFYNYGYSTINPFANNEFVIHYMIQRLITSNKEVKINNLMDELFISKYTINENLKIVRKTLSTYDLKVVKISNKGIIVKGFEQNKRICILNEYTHLNMMKNSIYFCKSYEEVIKADEEVNSIIRNIVEEVLFKDDNYTISANGVEKIIIAIKIIINRIKNGYNVDYHNLLDNKLEIRGTYTYTVTKRILNRIGEKLKISFNDEEVTFMSVIQLGFRDFVSYNEVFVKYYFDEGYNLASDILCHITDVTGIVDFERDKVLRERLALHFISCLIRIKNNLVIDYVPSYLMHKSSFLATELAVLAANVIKDKIKCQSINSNEINYLAFHFSNALSKIPMSVKRNCRFAIVSVISRDIVLALTEKMLSKYSGFVYSITAFEVYQIELIKDGEFDFIITDLPRDKFNHLNIPVIQHKYALYGDRNPELDRYYHNKYVMLSKLHKMTNEALFYNNIQGKDSEEILRALGNKIKDTLKIKGPLEEDLLERDTACTSERSNNMAILMTRNSYTDESFLSVAILNNSRIWFRESVQIILLFSLGKRDKLSAIECIRNFEKLIFDYSLTVKLLDEPTYDNFIKTVSEYYLKG